MKLCTQTERKPFQRQTALKLEHRNLFISILVEDPPDIKKQIVDNVVGWMDQSAGIIQVTIQFFEQLETAVLVFF